MQKITIGGAAQDQSRGKRTANGGPTRTSQQRPINLKPGDTVVYGNNGLPLSTSGGQRMETAEADVQSATGMNSDYTRPVADHAYGRN